jgi:hypothetical protein
MRPIVQEKSVSVIQLRLGYHRRRRNLTALEAMRIGWAERTAATKPMSSRRFRNHNALARS